MVRVHDCPPKEKMMSIVRILFERWAFVLVASMCAINVEVGNYGIAIFIGFLALDMLDFNN